MSAYAQCDRCLQSLPCIQMEPFGWSRYVCKGCLSTPSRLALLEAVASAAKAAMKDTMEMVAGDAFALTLEARQLMLALTALDSTQEPK